MKCVALLSGGKDSVAAIEVAQGHGWEVVAALRMVPQQDDAYMFHTPALDLVPAVAQCLGIPLVTADASPDPEAEVADLHDALAQIVSDHNVHAVVSGALASEYQRTRIDRVCHRLGLRSFAPLWHKDPATYLESLLAGGYDIRFSRVAADGLDATWIGQRLDQDRVQRLETLRMHPAGEGGEYESLVLDAPHYQRRIVVDAADVEATASRATWQIADWHTEEKASPQV